MTEVKRIVFSLIILALFTGLIIPALAKPNVITIIVKESKNTPLTHSDGIQIFDPEILGEPNWLWSGSTDSNGKLVLIDGVDVTLVSGKQYIIAWADFGTIGYLNVNHAGSAHVTVYLSDLA